MKKGEKKRPAIVFNPFAKLSPREKEECRGILTNPTYIKLMGIVQQYRPSANCKMAGSAGRDAFSDARASARLAEMRGWDTYENALFLVLTDAPVMPKAPEESFPDDEHPGARKPANPPNP